MRSIAATLAISLVTVTPATEKAARASERTTKSNAGPTTNAGGGTNPLVYVGFGVAGVGALVGSLYGADSLHATNTAKERCVDGRCPPSSFEFIDQAKTSAAISNVSFGVAIVGLGIGIYGLIAKPSSTGSKEESAPDYHPAPPGISLNVNVGPGSIALTGAF